MLELPNRVKYKRLHPSFGGFASSNKKDDDQINKEISEFEADELTGIILIIIGTLIWGYGSYVPLLIHSIFDYI